MLQFMIPQTVSALSISKPELTTPFSHSEQGPDFSRHGMALALQMKMIRMKFLEYVVQCRQTTISHW